MDTQITTHFDRYVDKNWHFQLDTSAIAEAQKYLSEYCQVEYKLKPESSCEMSKKTPASSSKTIPVTSSALSNAGNVASGKVSNTEMKKTPSRRIAVKSTGAPQLSARNSNTTKLSPAEENNDNSRLLRASGRIKKKIIDPDDIATESDEEYFPSKVRVKRSKLERTQQSDETLSVDATEGQQSSNESELVEVVSNCDAQTEIVESSGSDDVASASSKADETNGSTLLTSQRLENEKENFIGKNSKEPTVAR